MFGNIRFTMTKLKLPVAGLAIALLSGCNMYVIDFENRLPDGAVLAPKVETPPPPPPEPMAGSENIAFMDSSTAQLQGCRIITTVNLSHLGKFDDGLVMLRNTALQINANRIIPLSLFDSASASHPHKFRAKMLRCPEDKGA